MLLLLALKYVGTDPVFFFLPFVCFTFFRVTCVSEDVVLNYPFWKAMSPLESGYSDSYPCSPVNSLFRQITWPPLSFITCKMEGRVTHLIFHQDKENLNLKLSEKYFNMQNTNSILLLLPYSFLLLLPHCLLPPFWKKKKTFSLSRSLNIDHFIYMLLKI